eukprot:6249512-Alexandrium_andersonii.AAC.1
MLLDDFSTKLVARPWIGLSAPLVSISAHSVWALPAFVWGPFARRSRKPGPKASWSLLGFGVAAVPEAQ